MSTNINAPKFLVVVGASAGGIHSIMELTAQLTADMDAAFLIVLHLSYLPGQDSFVKRLQQYTDLTCKMAEDGETISSRYLYVAVPNKHLVVKDNQLILGNGPPENRWRPSIDVLFRSAAAAYNSRVIGIILTGMLQDGTAGMIAIKKCGGTCIVQDPNQAEYSEMPSYVLQNTEVDYCIPLEEMGTVISEKTGNGIPEPYPVPEDVKIEAQIAEKAVVDMNVLKKLGNHSVFTCPDCGGGLWEIKKDGITRFRCHTGHSYTQEEYEIKQKEALESTFWVALRMLEERKQLMDKIAQEEMDKGWAFSAEAKKERAAELKIHIERLKQLLFETKKVEI